MSQSNQQKIKNETNRSKVVEENFTQNGVASNQPGTSDHPPAQPQSADKPPSKPPSIAEEIAVETRIVRIANWIGYSGAKVMLETNQQLLENEARPGYFVKDGNVRIYERVPSRAGVIERHGIYICQYDIENFLAYNDLRNRKGRCIGSWSYFLREFGRNDRKSANIKSLRASTNRLIIARFRITINQFRPLDDTTDKRVLKPTQCEGTLLKGKKITEHTNEVSISNDFKRSYQRGNFGRLDYLKHKELSMRAKALNIYVTANQEGATHIVPLFDLRGYLGYLERETKYDRNFKSRILDAGNELQSYGILRDFVIDKDRFVIFTRTKLETCT